MMISNEDKKLIGDWAESVNSGKKDIVTLTLVTGNDALSPVFNDFFSAFEIVAPAVTVVRKKESESLTPYVRAHQNIIYQALPAGKQLPLFLDILSGKILRSEDLILKNNVPVELKLYVAEHCPYCPVMLERMLSLVLSNDTVSLKVIDGSLFSDLALSDSVMSAPVLMFETYRWTGVTGIKEIIEVIENTKPEHLSLLAIKNLIEEGGAERLAAMMIDRNQIFSSVKSLLIHEKWSVRLGAMVSLESVAEENPALAESVLPFVWEKINESETAVTGDLLYIVGVAGTRDDIEKLRQILPEMKDEEIKEAAEEAVAMIEERI